MVVWIIRCPNKAESTVVCLKNDSGYQVLLLSAAVFTKMVLDSIVSTLYIMTIQSFVFEAFKKTRGQSMFKKGLFIANRLLYCQ